MKIKQLVPEGSWRTVGCVREGYVFFEQMTHLFKGGVVGEKGSDQNEDHDCVAVKAVPFQIDANGNYPSVEACLPKDRTEWVEGQVYAYLEIYPEAQPQEQEQKVLFKLKGGLFAAVRRLHDDTLEVRRYKCEDFDKLDLEAEDGHEIVIIVP